MQAKRSKHQTLTQKEIALNFFASRPDEWFYDFEVPHDTFWGWLGSQKKRRIQELVEEGKLERETIGKYAAFSFKE